MKVIYKLCLLGLFGILWFGSCYDDKGNYDYHAINEVTMEHEFFGDTVLRMYSFVDTLRVVPEVKGTLDENLDHYEYEWIAVGDYFDKKGVLHDRYRKGFELSDYITGSNLQRLL